MNWEKITNEAFKFQKWDLLAQLPKNATFNNWISLKSVSFLELAKDEEIRLFINSLKKMNIKLELLENNKHFFLENYVVDKKNFKVLNKLLSYDLIQEPVKLLSQLQDVMDSISTTENQPDLINFINNLYEKKVNSLQQWKCLLPDLLVFSLSYGPCDTLNKMLDDLMKKCEPQETFLFPDPPMLGNIAYVYTKKISQNLEKNMMSRKRFRVSNSPFLFDVRWVVKEELLEKVIKHFNDLSKYSSFFHTALAPDGKNLGTAYDNISKIKKSIPPELLSLFEKIVLTNYSSSMPELGNKNIKKKML